MKRHLSEAVVVLAMIGSACSKGAGAEEEVPTKRPSSNSDPKLTAVKAPRTVAQPDLGRLVDLLTDKKASLPTPEDLHRRFQPVVDISTHEKTEYFWVMRAKAPPPGIRWVSAEFQPGTRPETWLFVQIELGLELRDADSQATAFESLSSQVVKRLGKASYHGNDPRAQQQYWRVRRGLELMLGHGLLRNGVTAQDEEQIVLSLHVPQGDPD